MTTWLLNPFTYIAGFKSLVIGWIIILITAFIAYYSHTHFDGAIDAHVGYKIYPAWHYVAEPFIAWSSIVIIYYATGKSFSASAIRFIDIAGTFALARWPFLFFAIINFIAPDVKNAMHLSPKMLLFAFISLVFSVWMIALMYNAFKVSCNIKGQKSVWLFIGSLIVAEALSKFILYYTLH
jgi:hypothetical protein